MPTKKATATRAAAPKTRRSSRKKNGAAREVIIAPSILSADFANLGRDLSRCRRARIQWIHIDVMDGHFVPNLTFGPPLVKCWRAAEPKLFFDTHLMVENPMALAEAFRDAGSDELTIHVEAAEDPVRDLRKIKRMGMKAGISIKPGTPVKAIEECLGVADLVLVMTVEPGFGGQSLIPKALNKVRELDLMRRERKLNFHLQVDGGINRETTPLAVAAGADVLVAGSAIFNAQQTIAESVRALREAIAAASAENGSPAYARSIVRTYR